jgi:dihydrofolate reductase
MVIALIAAMAQNRAIGINGLLPWGHFDEDLKRFKKITDGHLFIMGRKSYDTPDRLWSDAGNLVLSGRPSLHLEPGFEHYTDLEQALEACEGQKKVFILGGEQVFKQSLSLAHEIHLTRIEANFAGDAFFPPFEQTGDFECVEKQVHQGLWPYSFETWQRRK